MWGRDPELKILNSLLLKESSSLVVLKGRRRIGKSTLAQEFGRKYAKHYFEFSGLAPRPNQVNSDQLNQFHFQFKKQFKSGPKCFLDWNDAFSDLAAKTKKLKKTVILFDEISWMASGDPDFPGKLKIAWDTHFKPNSNCILILCGSVSTWIQENILDSTSYVGRISRDITLNELPLNVTSKFWKSWDQKVSDYEKLRFLAVTGCIPKYLEELDPKISSDENIKSLCFDSSGFLHDEFNKIFSDIFGKQTSTYKKIILFLVPENLSADQLAKKLNIKLSSSFLKLLSNLEISGFISRDYRYEVGAKTSRTSLFRLKDNYLRFSLKYIEHSPKRSSAFISTFSTLDLLPNWDSILGLQIENLVYNHLPEVLNAMEFKANQVASAAPYFQKKTAHNYGACQIDLLIQSTDNTAYIGEIKFRRRIDAKIIKEVERKINTLSQKRGWSYRPVLIYEGEIDPNDLSKIQTYFSKIIKLSELLRSDRISVNR